MPTQKIQTPSTAGMVKMNYDTTLIFKGDATSLKESPSAQLVHVHRRGDRYPFKILQRSSDRVLFQCKHKLEILEVWERFYAR